MRPVDSKVKSGASTASAKGPGRARPEGDRNAGRPKGDAVLW